MSRFLLPNSSESNFYDYIYIVCISGRSKNGQHLFFILLNDKDDPPLYFYFMATQRLTDQLVVAINFSFAHLIQKISSLYIEGISIRVSLCLMPISRQRYDETAEFVQLISERRKLALKTRMSRKIFS